MKLLPVERKWSEDGYVKLQEFDLVLSAFFRWYQQTIKGDPGNGIKFVFDQPNLGYWRGMQVELPGEFLAASPAPEPERRQASQSEQGQPEPKFEDRLYIHTEKSDLAVRVRPDLSLPRNRYVLKGEETVVYESENGQWWQYRFYDFRTHKPGKVIGYHWVGIPTPIKEGASTPTTQIAKEGEGIPTRRQKEIAKKLKPKPPAKFNVLIMLPENEIYHKLSSKGIRLSNCKFKDSIDDVYTFECKHEKKKPYKLEVLDYEPIVIKEFDKTEEKFLKKIALYKKEISSKQLKKPYSVTLPTRAMLFYETGNLNWQRDARKALNKKKSGTDLKILLSADEISRGVPFSVPGDKKNTCRFKLEKRDWDDPNLSQLTWDLPCVVQTFVNETGISNLKKTYRISGCLQTKVLGRHHLCLKKPKEVASFYPNKGWVAIRGKPKNKMTSIDKTMLRPMSPILSTDLWLRKTKTLQDPCNVIPHYQIVDVRYCDSIGSCLTKPWKIAKGKPLKLPSLDQIRWEKFKVLPSEVEFRFKKIEGEGFQNKPKIRVKIGKGTKLSSLIGRPRQKLISGPAIINDFGNIPSDLNAKFALFTSKKQCDRAVRSRPKYWRPYHPNHNGEMKAHQCTYGKVLKGRESLSNCVFPKYDSGKWVYSFLKDSFEGKKLPPCPGSPAFSWSNIGNWTDCFGSRTYSNGERYVGGWKDRRYHGQGTFSFFNGRVKQKQEGMWKSGRFLYARKPSPTVTAKKSTPKVDQQKRLELSRRTQEALQVLGLYSGKLDGIIGVITKSAIQRWQRRNGYSGTGEVTESQLSKLEQEAATMLAKKKPSPTVTAKKSSLEKAKEQCAEIGFTKGTEKFGDCVMKLLN